MSLSARSIVGVPLEDSGIQRESITLYNNDVDFSSSVFHVVIHYPIRLSILAFQPPPTSIIVSYSFCHLLYIVYGSIPVT